MIDFNNIVSLRESGFDGFYSIGEVENRIKLIPRIKGVYLVLYSNKEIPEFHVTGTGGHFKGRNPNVSIDELKNNWVEDTKVIYIGKAGGSGSSATLYSRIGQYLKFGQENQLVIGEED